MMLKIKCHIHFVFQSYILPPTITDQIRLWELERDRFKFNDGYLYNQFLSDFDFSMLRDYAKVRLKIIH